MKILIVEDEIELSKVIRQSLEDEHFIVESAMNFKEGLDKIIAFDYDLILLDIMLPDGSGINLLKELKKLHKKEAVIILSAKDSVDDKVEGLNLGADDYLSKPFHLAELHARVKSAIRRKNQDGDQSVVFKNVELFPDDRKVLINKVEVKLNRKEYDLLYYFIIRPEKLMHKTALAEAIWGDHMDQADSLDFIYSQIKNLRKKLKDHSAQFDIEAVYGVGYKLV